MVEIYSIKITDKLIINEFINENKETNKPIG